MLACIPRVLSQGQFCSFRRPASFLSVFLKLLEVQTEASSAWACERRETAKTRPFAFWQKVRIQIVQSYFRPHTQKTAHCRSGQWGFILFYCFLYVSSALFCTKASKSTCLNLCFFVFILCFLFHSQFLEASLMPLKFLFLLFALAMASCASFDSHKNIDLSPQYCFCEGVCYQIICCNVWAVSAEQKMFMGCVFHSKRFRCKHQRRCPKKAEMAQEWKPCFDICKIVSLALARRGYGTGPLNSPRANCGTHVCSEWGALARALFCGSVKKTVAEFLKGSTFLQITVTKKKPSAKMAPAKRFPVTMESFLLYHGS